MIFIGWFAWKIHDTFKALPFLSIPTKQHTDSTNGMSWGRDYLIVWPIAQKEKTRNVQVYLFICYSLFNDMTYSALKSQYLNLRWSAGYIRVLIKYPVDIRVLIKVSMGLRWKPWALTEFNCETTQLLNNSWILITHHILSNLCLAYIKRPYGRSNLSNDAY